MGEHQGLNRAGRRALQRKGRGRRAAVSSGAVLSLGSGLFGGATAASAGIAEACLDLVVEIEDDIVDPEDGQLSLREAVECANGTIGADEITFATGVMNVDVEHGHIRIFDPVTISGPGVTVAAVVGAEGSPHRVFDIDLSENGPDLVLLRGLTITGGSALTAENPQSFDDLGNGGGIRAYAVDLELDGVTVTGNTADVFGGGIYIGGEGFTGAELRLTNSTISGNNAPLGAGIAAKYVREPIDVVAAAVAPGVGGLVIDRSTITGNGGEVVEGKYAIFGGGLWVIESDLTMENSTVSGNSASDAGGVYAHDSTVDIAHSTIHANAVGGEGARAGGLHFTGSGDLSIDHSIFSGSVAQDVGGSPVDVVITEDGGSPTATAAWTLIQSLSDAGDVLVSDAATAALLGADPSLGSLQANGGPTLSHRPLSGSPVINAGDPALADAPATDQPGNPRIMGGRIDLGSVETFPPPPPPPPPPTPDPDPDPAVDPDPCEAAPEDGFVDVPSSNVHEAAIDCISSLGITIGGPGGLPDDRYGPDLTVTRGQAASFLARLIDASGAPLDPTPPDAFDDPATVHDQAIDQLAAAGIVQGTGPRTYDPTDPVTREQIASLLARTYAHITGQDLPAGPDAFTDDDLSLHETAINAIAAAGIAHGTGEGMFEPDADLRRDQMASFLTRLVQRLADDGHFPVNA